MANSQETNFIQTVLKPEDIGLEYAGVYNPGCFRFKDKTYLLSRVEPYQLKEFCYNYDKFYCGALPLLTELNNDLTPAKSTLLPKIFNKKLRCEDFRVFKFRGKLLINHPVTNISSCYKFKKNHYLLNGRYQWMKPRTRQGLSELQIDKMKINFLGFTEVDFKPCRVEKNWMYVELENELYLLYSFSPLIILKLKDLKNLTFQTFEKKNNPATYLKNYTGKFLSFSANPIVYDDKNFMLIIHEKGVDEIYRHWILLINNLNFNPSYVISKPILEGGKMKGEFSNIAYLTSILDLNDKFTFFLGEGDTYVSKMTLDKNFLSSQLKKL